MVQHNQRGAAANSIAIRSTLPRLSKHALTRGVALPHRCSRSRSSALATTSVLLLLFVGLMPERATAQSCRPAALLKRSGTTSSTYCMGFAFPTHIAGWRIRRARKRGNGSMPRTVAPAGRSIHCPTGKLSPNGLRL